MATTPRLGENKMKLIQNFGHGVKLYENDGTDRNLHLPFLLDVRGDIHQHDSMEDVWLDAAHSS